MIAIQFPDNKYINLTIKQVRWAGNNELAFYTNNPLNITVGNLPARRMLSAMP